MSKRPVNLTLDEGVLNYAEQIMQLRHFGTLVGLVEQLLREEYERRNGPVMMQEAAPPYKISSASRAEAARGEEAGQAAVVGATQIALASESPGAQTSSPPPARKPGPKDRRYSKRKPRGAKPPT